MRAELQHRKGPGGMDLFSLFLLCVSGACDKRTLLLAVSWLLPDLCSHGRDWKPRDVDFVVHSELDGSSRLWQITDAGGTRSHQRGREELWLQLTNRHREVTLVVQVLYRVQLNLDNAVEFVTATNHSLQNDCNTGSTPHWETTKTEAVIPHRGLDLLRRNCTRCIYHRCTSLSGYTARSWEYWAHTQSCGRLVSISALTYEPQNPNHTAAF